jgi:hypothetical protein
MISNEIELDALCCEYVLHRYDDARSKVYKQKISNAIFVLWALNGNDKRGLPMLPIQLADESEKWDAYLRFSKHQSRHQTSSDEVDEAKQMISKEVDRLNEEMDAEYERYITKLQKKGQKKKFETAQLLEYSKTLELEQKIKRFK